MIDSIKENLKKEINHLTILETEYQVELAINEADQFELATQKALFETKPKNNTKAKNVRINTYKEIFIRKNLILKLVC
jgi:hypothetical protein